MSNQPPQTDIDLIGLFLATLPVILPFLLSGKRVQGILNLLRRFATLVAIKDAKTQKDGGHELQDRAAMLLLTTLVKRVDKTEQTDEEIREEVKLEIRERVDSILLSMNRFRTEVRASFLETNSRIDVTNQRVNVIGDELTKLQTVVYSMNGNGKHAEDNPTDE